MSEVMQVVKLVERSLALLEIADYSISHHSEVPLFARQENC